MAERLAYSERLRKAAKKTVAAVGIATITATLASCRYAPKPAPSSAPKELVECELNARPGDPDPTILKVSEGEAVSVFPGTLEFPESGDIVVQPVIQLGQTSILAAQELVFDVEANGFRVVPLDRGQLKTARWRISSAKGTPGEPGAMTESDECRPGSVAGRTYIHAQYLRLEQAARTSLTDQAPSNDQVIIVPLSRVDQNQRISIEQWPEGDVFGTRLPEEDAAKYRTGVSLYEVVVPVS